jgi:hypothetical protein
MYNVALGGLLCADHKNIKAIASLFPSAITPLSKQVLTNNLDQFGEDTREAAIRTVVEH